MTEKHTPQEWAALRNIRILDPDGWRRKDDPPFDQPLTYDEYWPREAISTIQRLNGWVEDKQFYDDPYQQ